VRDAPDGTAGKRNLLRWVAGWLQVNGELEVAERLREDAMRGAAREAPALLLSEIDRAHGLLADGGDDDAALDLLTGPLRSRVARCDDAGVRMHYHTVMATVLRASGRLDEAVDHVAESVAFAKTAYGPESAVALTRAVCHATLLVDLSRVGEGLRMLVGIHDTQARVLGAEHVATRTTREYMTSVVAAHGVPRRASGRPPPPASAGWSLPQLSLGRSLLLFFCLSVFLLLLFRPQASRESTT